MWLFHDEEWTRGRRGIAILRTRLRERTAQPPTASELEREMSKLFRRENLPQPVRQFEVQLSFGPIHIDFAYPEISLAIETDSYAYHGNKRAFDGDRERDAELQALGWGVLRFTWSQVRWRGRFVADVIRRNYGLRSGLYMPSA